MPFSFLLTIVFIEILVWGEIEILVPSFPAIQDEFSINAFKTELLLSVNLFANCIASLVIGLISDQCDKKKVIIFCLIIFFIASILGYFSQTYNLLLLARILQGIGISGPMLLCNVLIANYYPLKLQQQLIGIVNGLSTVVLIFAPVLGSTINVLFGWRANFILFIIITIINLILTQLYIPKSDNVNCSKIIDIGYLGIIKSKKTLLYVFIINLIVLPYWTFLGLGPILFVKDLNISLSGYSIYQTSLAISFTIVSFTSTFLINKLGSHKTFKLAAFSLLMFILLVIYIIKFDLNNPILIIISIHILNIGTAFIYKYTNTNFFKTFTNCCK